MKAGSSMAEKTGAAALAAAAAAAAFSPAAAVIPLAAFVLACATAPFFPRFGFFVPVLSRGLRNRPEVALTFDDGPDPETTPALLELLARSQIRAAFFVVGRRVEEHPDLVRQIVLGGHEIGWHSYDHDVLLGLRSPASVTADLRRAAAALAGAGVRPLAFRPPVGILTPRIGAGLQRTGMMAVTFSRRGWDAGNRRLAGLSGRILGRLRAGDVILLHDKRPAPPHDRGQWLAEVEAVIEGIRLQGLSVVSLEALIGRPIMEVLDGTGMENR
jgi:peptidoglycan/xylan/chitin deacetylase (PgdA/CDA1 family)